MSDERNESTDQLHIVLTGPDGKTKTDVKLGKGKK